MWLSPVLAFLLVQLSPFGLCPSWHMHLSLTRWGIGGAGLIVRARPVLLIRMDNDPWGWDIAYHRLVALDAVDGSTRGQLVEDDPLQLLGVTTSEVWVNTGIRGTWHVAGYSLPDLEQRYDQDDVFAGRPDLGKIIEAVQVDGMGGDLRVKALDGHSYRLTPRTGKVKQLPLDPPPPASSLLAGWRECRWKEHERLYDHRGCKPMEVDGDPLTIRSIPRGQTSIFVIGRRRAHGAALWEVSEVQLFGDRDDDPRRLIRYATLDRDRILLVAEDGRGRDDVYAAAIHVKDGKIIWTRTFW